MSLIINSISFNNSPLNMLISEKFHEKKGSLDSIASPLFFHLLENEKHFLAVVKIKKIEKKLLLDGKEKVEQYFQLESQKYSLKEAQNTFLYAPKSADQFIQDLSKLPLLELETEKPKQAIRFFFLDRITVNLSLELQSGISGERGPDHAVSVDLLKRCIKKKIQTIPKKPKTDFYFFDKEKNRILNVVVLYGKNQFFTIKTAYYPSDSTLKKRLNNCTDCILQDWKSKRAKV